MIALSLVGSGSVIGSGCGIHQYCVSLNDASKSNAESTKSEDLSPKTQEALREEAEQASKLLSVEVKSDISQPESSELKIEEDDDSDEDLEEERSTSRLTGRLYLHKGLDSFTDSDSYQFKLDLGSNSEEIAVEKDVAVSFDINQNEDEVNRFISDLNNSFWVNPDDLSEVLKEVEGKKAKFVSLFSTDFFNSLKERLEGSLKG
nr:hypothetical protein [Candidatus Mycoplasma haematolamae]